MGDKSKIEWTDATWNPVTGCTRVSPGCQNCYAERLSARFGEVEGSKFQGMALMTTKGPRWTRNVACHEEVLREPLRWKKPRRIFVNSVSDTFHEKVPDEFLDRMFAVMALTPWHTYQVLTKRPERMTAYMAGVTFERLRRWMNLASDGLMSAPGKPNLTTMASAVLDKMDDMEMRFRLFNVWPLPNVWLGTSVEDHARAEERIPWLLKCPAAVRFLSCEPLLGPVDLTLDGLVNKACSSCDHNHHDPETNIAECKPCNSTGKSDDWDIDWVIAGGESGPGARPVHPDWVRGVRDQCVAAGVPFFFKQHGDWIHESQVEDPALSDRIEDMLDRRAGLDVWLQGSRGSMYRVGKKAAGRVLDGRTWEEMPDGSPALPAGG